MENRKKNKKTAKEVHGLKGADSTRQAEIILALREESLAAKPLQQEITDEIDNYCGIIPSGALPKQAEPTVASDQPSVPINLVYQHDDEGESILGALDFDSDDDLSDEEDLGGSGP